VTRISQCAKCTTHRRGNIGLSNKGLSLPVMYGLGSFCLIGTLPAQLLVKLLQSYFFGGHYTPVSTFCAPVWRAELPPSNSSKRQHMTSVPRTTHSHWGRLCWSRTGVKDPTGSRGSLFEFWELVQYEVDVGESTTWRCHADHLLPAKGDSSGGGFGARAISPATSHAEEEDGILLILQGAQQPCSFARGASE